VTATGPLGDRYEGLIVNIIKPDGSNDTFGPYQADPTGGIWFTYTPTAVGNYSVQATYPGQTLTYGTTYNGLQYLGSVSDVAHFTVQQEAVINNYHTPPLPTEYWSRPIYASNYEWAQLGGNWLGLKASGFSTTGVYDAVGAFQPFSTAPNTGHIVWVKPTKFGGQVGGPMPADQTYQYTSTSIEFTEFEPIIINGILYYCQYPAGINTPQSWQAVDLRTGEPLAGWNTTAGITGTERLRYGEVMGMHTIQEFGSMPLLWSEDNYSPGAAGSAPPAGQVTFRLYDPMTGFYYAKIVNGTDIPMISDYNPDTTEPGTLIGWYTSSNSTGTFLILWNSTRAIAYPWGYTGGMFMNPGYGSQSTTQRDIRVGWGGVYETINWTAGIQWTVQLPNKLGDVPVSGLSIAVRTPEVIVLRSAPSTASASAGYQVTVGINARTGAVMWGPLNQTIPAYHDIAVLAGSEGYYVLRDKDTDQVYGYSLTDGKQVWGPVQLIGNAWSHISLAAEIAYDKIFIYDYGGYVNAVDLATGAIVWTYTPAASNDIPDGTYPIWTYDELVCDGKIFLPQGKLYDPPLSPGTQRLAINCTDGSVVWSELGYTSRMTAAAADGYLVQWNSYDKQIYTLGKGPTATTLSASPKTSVQGDSVIIEGFITDESAGTKNVDRVARFPQGVPVVSDESMSPWMEYVYMQQAKPTNTTGVPVTLSVLDSNGNYRTIGITTTDSSGMFNYQWTPDIDGKYTVMATFAGSESYWPSSSETSFAVDPAAPTPSPYPQITLPPTEMYIAASAAAIIVAIAIVGVIVVMMLRKRP
jgi:hypothetical protein